MPSLEVVEEVPQELNFIKPATPPMAGRIDLDRSGQDPEREPGTRFEVSPVLKKGAKKKRRKKKRNRPNQNPPANPWAPANAEDNGSDSMGPADSSESFSLTQTETVTAEPTEPEESAFTVPDETVRPRSIEVHSSSRERRRRNETPPARQRRQRPARKRPATSDGSSGIEIVKVIIGAMLALPVAQLLIWWVFGKDPLNLGPTVSGVIPAVVPADFQQSVENGDDDSSTDDVADDDQGGDLPLPDDNVRP
ncbi:MAG: hypothetical protein AAF456_15815 [Planctomycetota bacterium]